MIMNKILIALVLAVVMSGNAYANFITDLFKSEREMCLEAVEKGKLVFHKRGYSDKIGDWDYVHDAYAYKSYAYNGKLYLYYSFIDKCIDNENVE